MSRRVRVAIVDDHLLIRTALAGLLSASEDFELVGEAGDGPAAVELARRCAPDVVVMDFKLPGVDGAEAARSIRAGLPGVRIIGFTGCGAEAERQLREAGAVACLGKDADVALLTVAIRYAAEVGEAEATA